MTSAHIDTTIIKPLLRRLPRLVQKSLITTPREAQPKLYLRFRLRKKTFKQKQHLKKSCNSTEHNQIPSNQWNNPEALALLVAHCAPPKTSAIKEKLFIRIPLERMLRLSQLKQQKASQTRTTRTNTGLTHPRSIST